jgi:hypothetical protein
MVEESEHRAKTDLEMLYDSQNCNEEVTAQP